MKTLPHSIDAEASLLGAMMLDPRAADRVSGMIGPEHFFRELHATIFAAIIDCGAECDPLNVADWFFKRKMQADVDNGAYLTELANNSAGPSMARSHARLIVEKAQQRKMIDIGHHLAESAAHGADVAELCESLHSELAAIDRHGTTGPRTLTQVAGTWINHLEALSQVENRLDTGLADVDRIIQGLLPGELMVLAGRPSMGKTAAMMTILQNVSQNTQTLLFSCEMSGEQLLKRMVAGRDVPGHKFRDPRKMSKDDWKHVTAGMMRAKKHKILIDDTGGITMNQIEARAREAKRSDNIGLIAVDYLQLVTCKAENRLQEVSVISRRLKKMAKDLNLPVIAVSQLSRAVENRTDRRPKMSDIRESGQLEQDADIITFLYRNGYYVEDDRSGITEWITAKHRDSEPGTAYTRFDGARAMFVNADFRDIELYKQDVQAQAAGGSNWSRRKGMD